MITNASFDRLEYLIADAKTHGAILLVGGKRYTHPKYPKGHYFSPTLLINVSDQMAIAREELFAPICLVMRATNVDEAISIANSTPYALGASVFGSKKRDLERCVSEMQAGMVAVNDFAVYYAVQLPFGGVKGSGYGRFAGEEGLRALCNTKSVCRDRWPLISTSIPPALDYPIGNAHKVSTYLLREIMLNHSRVDALPLVRWSETDSVLQAWEFAKAIVELGYTGGLGGRIKAVWKIIRNS